MSGVIEILRCVAYRSVTVGGRVASLKPPWTRDPTPGRRRSDLWRVRRSACAGHIARMEECRMVFRRLIVAGAALGLLVAMAAPVAAKDPDSDGYTVNTLV